MTYYFGAIRLLSPSGSLYVFDNVFRWMCVTGAAAYRLFVYQSDLQGITVLDLTSAQVGCVSGIASYLVPTYNEWYGTPTSQLPRTEWPYRNWFTVDATAGGDTWTSGNSYFILLMDVPGQLILSDTLANDNNISDILQSTLSIEDT